MNREIKFRAWIWKHEPNEEWGYEGEREMCYDLAFEEYAPINDLLNNTEFPLMQYTGLKDKNRKEIYEGDIVQCDIYEREQYDDWYSGKPIEVKWDSDASGFFPFNKGSQWRSGCENIELLGNIYEHPNLLK